MYKISPCFRSIYVFFLNLRYFASPPILTVMHLCIMLYSYWMPLDLASPMDDFFIVISCKATIDRYLVDKGDKGAIEDGRLDYANGASSYFICLFSKPRFSGFGPVILLPARQQRIGAFNFPIALKHTL